MRCEKFKLRLIKFNIICLISSIFLTVADQVIKIIVYNNIKDGSEIRVVGNLLVFQYLENRGAVFGWFQGWTFLLIWLTGILLLSCILAVAFGYISQKFYVITFSLIVAGGFGNLMDRIFRGYVVDFIYLKFLNYFKIIDVYIFNLADMCVFFGVVSIIIHMLFFEKEKETEKKKAAS